MTRFIKLREHPPNLVGHVTPEDDYIATCDETISKKEYSIRTDPHGFLIEKDQRYSPEGSIIYLGGSFVENIFVDEDKRACRFVERFIRNSGLSFNVLNGGVSGATSLEVLNVVINKCLPLQPKAILLTIGLVDMIRLVNTEDNYWSQITGPDTTAFSRRSVDPHRFADRDAAIDLIAAVCRTENIPLFLTTWGFTARMLGCWTVKVCSHLKIDWLNSAFEINQMTRMLSERNKIECIDLALEMNDQDRYYYDGIHPNAIGCEKIGEIIGNRLVSHFRE